MGLSNDLISQFVKITNDNKKESKETTVYGTVTDSGDAVVLDGQSDSQPIPISKNNTVAVSPGNRVTVLVKNHSVIVTGNIADPSPSTGTVTDTVETATKSMEASIIQKLDAKYITADQVAAKYINADTFNAKTATIDGTLTAHAGSIDTLTSDNVTIKQTLTAHSGVIDKLDATYAKIDRVEAAEGRIDDLESETAKIGSLTADNATIKQTLNAHSGVINALESTYAKIGELDAIEGDIDELEAKTAKIDTLIFGEASGDTMHANFANAVIALLGNAWIKSAMVESLSADKITGDVVITEDLQIVSDDGHIVIKNGVIQVLDDNKNVRVQLGKDASGRYSITIWDTNGNKMFDAGGITADAIKSDIIVDSMVSATADIDASKLNIDSLFNVINNDGTKTINATKVKLDTQGQSLEVAFNSMKTSVDELQNDVESQGSDLTVVKDKITSKVWQQDINTAKSELKSETTNLSTKYSTLEQTVNGISATVANHTTDISKKADSSTVTAVNTKVTELETNLSGFKSTVSETYATKQALASTDSNISSLVERVSTAETSISHNADELALRATKTEVATAKAEAVTSANSNTSNQLKNYSTTSEMNAAITMSADSITSTVNSTYATKNALADTQGSLDTTHALAESANDGVVEAQSSIKQLSESIASLVTDGNGTSLMTQTDDGWTFSTADIQSSVNNVSEALSSLLNDVGDIDSAIGVLQQSVSDLGVTAEYIRIGVYEDEPCIELGESDSDFKLIITNTRILFMEGSSVPAYITKQSLHITKAVIEEEIQQGEFVWKVRQNGNMGLMWKGGV